MCQAKQYCKNKSTLEGLTKYDEKNGHGKQILPHASQGRGGSKASDSGGSASSVLLWYIRMTWDESTLMCLILSDKIFSSIQLIQCFPTSLARRLKRPYCRRIYDSGNKCRGRPSSTPHIIYHSASCTAMIVPPGSSLTNRGVAPYL